MAISKPWPSSPTRFSAGTSTFSKKSSPVEPAQMPSLFSVSARRHARPLALDDERRDAAVLRVGIGLREDERVVGDAGVGDPVLLAVEDVGVALAAGVREHPGDVRAGGGLGEPEAGELVAARLRGEVALLLLLVGVAEKRQRVEADVDRDERPEGRLAALDLLADERLGNEVEPGAAVFLRDDDAEQAELGHARDRLHVEVVVDVVLDRVRKHALVHELADGRLHLSLLGVSSKSTATSLSRVGLAALFQAAAALLAGRNSAPPTSRL